MGFNPVPLLAAGVVLAAVWTWLFRAMAPDMRCSPDYPLARGVLAAVFTVPVGGLPALVVFAALGGTFV